MKNDNSPQGKVAYQIIKTDDSRLLSRRRAILQLILFSSIGIFTFFIPLTINNRKTILFDYAASHLINEHHSLAVTLLFLLMTYGAIKPLINRDYKKSWTLAILTFVRISGLVLATIFILGMAPEPLMQKDMMPFLFNNLALPIGIIVPIGALFLASLIGFGLLEIIGVLMQPIMRPIWRTPGSSAVDAVASFIGSYSVGLLITNKFYLQDKYSTREAIIIATGFSTVSAAFMIIVAKTLNLMLFWNLFFWSTLIITFVVTAITARIPPISLVRNDDFNVLASSLSTVNSKRLSTAFNLGIESSRQSANILKIFWSNFIEGLEMTAAIVPSIIAVGLAGLLLDKYTPLFDILGLLLYPFAWVVGLPDPMLAAKGISAGLAEMFLPSLLLADADLLTRYVAGVVSISSILFFSAMIPSILATKIPLSIPMMLVIWFQRTVLSIILATLFAQLALSFGWLF